METLALTPELRSISAEMLRYCLPATWRAEVRHVVVWRITVIERVLSTSAVQVITCKCELAFLIKQSYPCLHATIQSS
jgi:hypothetical protein